MRHYQSVDVAAMFDRYSDELLQRQEDIEDEIEFATYEAEAQAEANLELETGSVVNTDNFNDNF